MTELDLEARRVVKRAPSGRLAKVFEPYPAEAAAALERELRRTVGGPVDFGPGGRALFATDASNYRQTPIGVVTPRTLDDVRATIEACRRHHAPVLPRGGGTALAGQTCNVAVVIDFSRWLDKVLEIDPDRRLARVEPGCILDTLRNAAEAHHLTFGPDPATHDHNTLGGMIGNDSCGVHSVMAGRTSGNVERLRVLTYDGLEMDVGPTGDDELAAILAAGGRRAEIYRRLLALRETYAGVIRERFPKIPRRVSGFANLDALFRENGFNLARALTGTEGSCVCVLEATVKLVPSPPCRALAILAFDDVFCAADAVCRVLEHAPLACEGMDDLLTRKVRAKRLHQEGLEGYPEGGGWLIVEFGGDTPAEAAQKADRLIADFDGRGRRVSDPAEQEKVWAVRESGLGATAFVPGEPDAWPGWEDSAVAPEDLGVYLRELKALMRRHGYEASFYGHFGDGLVHCRIDFDLRTEAGIDTWRRFLSEAADLVIAHGGSLSGEHGDGEARAEFLERMYGPELVACFGEFKAIWDPEHRMNPGKVVAPFPADANLRIGPAYQPPTLATHFAYPDDEGSFARAALRCVGVGACRRLDVHDEVMCPSYLVTRDEKHSTRGRARLLFEMLRGETIKDGWRSREVEEALSLCLACKGCKSDCPVEVDMATYKAEFRAHHYRGRLRPRDAYSLGLIWWWARAAERAPGLANWMLGAPIVSGLVKRAAGVASDRPLPQFARRSFVRQFAPAGAGGERVILWPDTFNNWFRPQTASAAARLLGEAGYQVALPDRPLCCGRPLYDWGFLDLAKSLWRRTLRALRPEIEAGTPVVGLEPACLAAFKDELPHLFPDEPLAARLSENAVYFADFVDANLGRFPAFEGGGQVLAQPHCQHHAILGFAGEASLLSRLGFEVERPAFGCCGGAGAFAYAEGTAELSSKIAERGLLPAVREAAAETTILADGFSCREQIEHGAGRPALHIAELLARRTPPQTRQG